MHLVNRLCLLVPSWQKKPAPKKTDNQREDPLQRYLLLPEVKPVAQDQRFGNPATGLKSQRSAQIKSLPYVRVEFLSSRATKKLLAWDAASYGESKASWTFSSICRLLMESQRCSLHKLCQQSASARSSPGDLNEARNQAAFNRHSGKIWGA
jgi:hypothetical protein